MELPQATHCVPKRAPWNILRMLINNLPASREHWGRGFHCQISLGTSGLKKVKPMSFLLKPLEMLMWMSYKRRVQNAMLPKHV